MSLKFLPKGRQHKLPLVLRIFIGFFALFLTFIPHNVEALIKINEESKEEIVRPKYKYVQRIPAVPSKPPQIQYSLKQDKVIKNNEKALSQPTATQTQNNINQEQKDLLNALNTYRQKNGGNELSWDNNLGDFAQTRAEFFIKNNGMDNHSGFNDFINNDGFKKLGFSKLGENSSYGYDFTPTDLIEKAYGESPSHNQSQLSSEWTHVGIGVNEKATNFIFGGKKI